MTRLGMSELISTLRQYAQADENEYTLAGETYWSDEHLQAILDLYRVDTYQETVSPVPVYENDTTVYRDYYWRYGDVERAASGTAIWQVWDDGGNAVGTADYSADYAARRIRFNNATDGGNYLLSYSSYNVYRAAAEVWRRKAANVASRFDITTDNHQLKRSQLQTAYLKMADHYDRLAASGAGQGAGGGARFVSRVRSDLNG